MSITLIAAVTNNSVIGKDNDLVWRNPEDMKHFRELTTGHTVLMGRKSWESIPEKYRPLPKRLNVVITRQANYALPQGVRVYSSVQQALTQLNADGDVYVIGGGEIYAAAMPFADTLEITHVDIDAEGTVYFPPIDPLLWEIVSTDQRFGFRFVRYNRRTTL